jgi:hypothetical protein
MNDYDKSRREGFTRARDYQIRRLHVKGTRFTRRTRGAG